MVRVLILFGRETVGGLSLEYRARKVMVNFHISIRMVGMMMGDYIDSQRKIMIPRYSGYFEN